MLRSGYPGNLSGPTYFLPAGEKKNPVYNDEFLERNGAKKYSSVIMTPTGYITREAWKEIIPLFIKGIRFQVREVCFKHGVDAATADRLLVGVFFDGCKVHTAGEEELLQFADNNCLCAVENRDSSEMNQAFDKFVARAGKKRAAEAIDMLRRSHIDPVIDRWTLVMVGLAMLRDCDASNVWESSFIAVNMHPHHRISFEDWMEKNAGFARAADKFSDEVIDLSSMLPKTWLEIPTQQRKEWLKTVEEHNAVFDVDLLSKLRADGMSLTLLSNMFRIYHTEQQIAAGTSVKTYTNAVPNSAVSPPLSTTVSASTPPTAPPVKKRPTKKTTPMIYHLFKIPKDMNMTQEEKLQHAITVRNRTLGPKRGTTVSPHLDVEITSMNQAMLSLKPSDVNMYRVLQQSTCKSDVQRKVAKRTLTALGGASGMCGVLNGPEELKKLKSHLRFAQSIEEVRAAEKQLKQQTAEAKKRKKELAKKKKEERAVARERKLKRSFDKAMEKLGLQRGDPLYRRHMQDLTGPQLKAIAYFQCGKILTGKVADIREELETLIPVDPDHNSDTDDLPDDGVPEYPTQDEVYEDPDDLSSSSEETTATTEIIDFEHLYIGDIVEVYWKGDDKWYEGVITDVDAVDKQFEVLYRSDSKKL